MILFSKPSIITIVSTGCGSVWLERRLREAEAASSNLVTPIVRKRNQQSAGFFFGFIGISYETAILQQPLKVLLR